MIFRQLFDRTSCTYTYLIASGGEAVARAGRAGKRRCRSGAGL